MSEGGTRELRVKNLKLELSTAGIVLRGVRGGPVFDIDLADWEELLKLAKSGALDIPRPT